MNDLLLDALRGSNTRRPPVWLMRQAGRYMPQYRKMREHHTLWEMFHRPEIASQVTLLPIELLNVDAAILFSDILVIVESLGLKMVFQEKGGPIVLPAIVSKEQIDELPLLDVNSTLSYVFETICRVKPQISVPLIGFCGGPFTVATYCIDSTSEVSFMQTRKWIAQDPQSLHVLLDKITLASIAYLKEQIKAGAQVIQVFDSWANILSSEEFQEFCLPYLRRIVEAIKDLAFVIVFCRDSTLRYAELASLTPSCISFDDKQTMSQMRSQLSSLASSTIAIQGNVPPDMLKRPISEIQKCVDQLLLEMRGDKGFIVNLSHGVLPDTPLENVKYFVEAITLS